MIPAQAVKAAELRSKKIVEVDSGPLLEYQSPTASLLAHPVSAPARNVIPAITIFLTIAVILMCVVPINRVTEGYGEVIADKDVDLIQPLQSGIVKSILVKPGQHVEKGQALAELDPTFAQSDLGSLQAQYDSAQTAMERYQAEVSNKPYVPTRHTSYTAGSLLQYQSDIAQFKSTMSSYETKVKGLQAQVTGAQTDLAQYTKEAAISDQVLDKRSQLYKLNVGSELDLLSAQSQADELHREVQSTQSTLASAQQDLSSMIAEEEAYKQSFYSQASASLASNQATEEDAGSQMAKDLLLRQIVVMRADQPGYVLTIAAAPAGSVLQSGDQLITIQPDSSKIVVQLDFPAEMAGYMQVGQKVGVKFLAYNYTTHGLAFGTLTSITASSFLANASQTAAANATQGITAGPALPSAPQTSLPTTDVVSGLFYRGLVTINKLEMRNVPKDFKPEPGMAVTADDVVGTRTPMSLMLERIVPSFSEFGHVP